jgi:hypothetical protein
VANYFDKYDTPEADTSVPVQGNYFDQFDQSAAPGWIERLKQWGPGWADQLRRQAALTARYVAEGAAGITDPINAALGLPTASSVTGKYLTQAGLPEPETKAEKIAAAGSKGLMQAGILGPAAGGLDLATVGAGGIGGAASEYAQQAGASPLTQALVGIGAGAATPMAAGAASDTLGALARGAKSYFQPFTSGGQNRAVGSLLNRFSASPQNAIANIESAPEFVPGSMPTTAIASEDPGLIALQRGLMNQPENASMFTMRQAENNAARVNTLGEMAGDKAALDAARSDRDAQAKINYGLANSEPLNLTTQNQKDLFTLLQRPSMKSAQAAADKIAQEDGVRLSSLQVNDPQWLHYIKLGLDDLINTGPQQGIGAAQQRAIISTKNAYLDWLDSVNPAYASARQAYAAASKPIGQMEALQDILSRSQVAAPDFLRQPVLSQALFKRATATPEAQSELAKVLTPDQMGTLGAIGSDLNREALLGSVGKAVGSNTMQNLAMANVLQNALGSNAGTNPIARFFTYPLSIPYKWSGANQQIEDLLDRAMLNPQLGAQLMRAAPTQQAREALAAALMRRAASSATGATIGSLGQVTSQGLGGQ